MAQDTSKGPQRGHLIGNLGKDPHAHSLKAKTYSKFVYDEVIDEMVLKEQTLPEKNFLTFSVAVNEEGKETRWFQCIDWDGCTLQRRQGDFVELYGYFEPRTFVKDGTERTIQQFVVEGCRLINLKIREEVD